MLLRLEKILTSCESYINKKSTKKLNVFVNIYLHNILIHTKKLSNINYKQFVFN